VIRFLLDRLSKSKRLRENVQANTDQELIAEHVPELLDMSDVDGMAYVLRQIEHWNNECTLAEAKEFTLRLAASQKSWDDDGLVMPYWGNLWVLRTYQKSLGHDAPYTSPPRSS